MVAFFDQLNTKAVLIGDVPVDVLVDENVPLESDVTEHPVEVGSDISDHRRKRPRFLTLNCVFLDYDPGGVARTVSSVRNGTFSTATWRQKRDRLVEMWQSDDLISVTLPEESFTDMQLLNIRPDRRPQSSNGYFFVIELKKMRRVSTETAFVDPETVPKEVEARKTDDQTAADKRKQDTQNKGKKQAETAIEQQQSTLQGVLSGLGI
jgi:hypothetical protein